MRRMNMEIEGIRKELLDLSRRNKFINYNLNSSRNIELSFVNPSLLYNYLVNQNKTFSFLNNLETIKDLGNAPVNGQKLRRGKMHPLTKLTVSSKLPTNYTQDDLGKKLKKAHADAKRLIEEQGMNLLFIAIGMLEWSEDNKGKMVNNSPLIFIPVELVRTNVKSMYRVRYTGEEVITNKSLIKKLEDLYDVELPVDLLDIEDEHGFDIDDYLLKFEGIINRFSKKWTVHKEKAVLNLFTYNKFVMYNDLNPANWKVQKKLLENPLLTKLFFTGFNESLEEITDEQLLDENQEILNIHNVLEADSSQTLAMHEVNNGKNLVIWGPPGTGKSQTITNIIAESIRRGKKILFVSEKMAALDVVKKRLEAVGLGDACLELHSHKMNKQQVIDELKRTYDLTPIKRKKFDRHIYSITEYRQKLNNYCKSINTPILNSNTSAHDCMGSLLSINEDLGNANLPIVIIDGLEQWDYNDFERKRNLIAEVEEFIKTNGLPKSNPFWGADISENITAIDSRLLYDEIDKAIEYVEFINKNIDFFEDILKVNETNNLDFLDKIIDLVKHVLENIPDIDINFKVEVLQENRHFIQNILRNGKKIQHLQTYENRLKKRVWSLKENEYFSLYDIRDTLNDYNDKWYKHFTGSYQKSNGKFKKMFRKLPPKNHEHRMDILNTIIKYYEYKTELHTHGDMLKDIFKDNFDYEKTDWIKLNSIMENVFIAIDKADSMRANNTGVKKLLSKKFKYNEDSLVNLQGIKLDFEKVLKSIIMRLRLNLNTLGYGTIENIDLEEFLTLLKKWKDSSDELQSQITLNNYLFNMKKESLSGFIEAVVNWDEADELLLLYFDKLRCEALLDFAKEKYPAFNYFDRSVHENIIEKFEIAEEEMITDYNRITIAEEHTKQILKLKQFDEDAVSIKSQLGILQSEFHKKRVSPLRKIIANAWNPILMLKPVFMMSPMSVAKYIKPGVFDFDLIIFDEASQIRPQDAIGAIARGKQVVVVGDDKQLPPTSFFDTMVESIDDEKPSISDYESILKRFMTSGANIVMLKWHYRSKHESLIRLSNSEFYDDKLFVFPSPIKESIDLGVKYHYVDGIYDRGRTQTNVSEAKEIAQKVMEHVKKYPNDSIGVATLNTNQRDAIIDEIEELRRENMQYEDYFNPTRPESFFVKNLESIQGDERDVIFISVGYGKDFNGKLLMNFGPLNNDGGERRLNVLITRARKRCEVFSSLRHTDIDLNKTNARGVKVLKEFLRYAETKQLKSVEADHEDFRYPFEDYVKSKLISRGYEIVDNIGCSGFYIDIAVIDPNEEDRYVVGIECDGNTYATSRSARDRDRLKNMVLKSKGWNIYKLWSASYFNNLDTEMDDLCDVIDQSLSAKGKQYANIKASKQVTKEQYKIERVNKDKTKAVNSKSIFPKYKYRNRIIKDIDKILEKNPLRLSEYVLSLVKNEGPIHRDLVIKRIKDMVEMPRITMKLKTAVDLSIEKLVNDDVIYYDGSFAFIIDKPVIFRDRRGMLKYFRDIDYVSKEELAVAMFNLIKNNHGVTVDGVANIVSKFTGYERTDSKIVNRVKEAAKYMVNNGILVFDGYGYLQYNNEYEPVSLKYRNSNLFLTFSK